MYASMWSYPWDLADCGIHESLADMKANGLTGVSMITSYHAGRFLQLRSRKRKIYFPEDGVTYYPTDLSRFRRQKIQPRVGKFIQAHPTFWHDLLEESRKLNMTVSGWTVCLHNTRIGMAYPDTCVHNAYGDAVYYNQCPSNPDVRLYMNTLVDDICAHLPLYSLELESLNFMGHAHEFHHEKDGIGLTALEDFLLSLCFCDSCVARAKKEGLDILPAKETVKGWLDRLSERDVPPDLDQKFFAQGIDFFRDTPEVYQFLKWRSTVVTSLMEEVYKTVGGRSKLYFLSLLPHSKSWIFGVDLRSISARCDGAVVCSYDCGADQTKRDLEECHRTFAKGADLLVGMRAFMPEYHNKAEFAEKVKTAYDQKADGFLFYNYGLIPPIHLAWIKDSLQSAEKQTGACPNG